MGGAVALGGGREGEGGGRRGRREVRGNGGGGVDGYFALVHFRKSAQRGERNAQFYTENTTIAGEHL